MGLKNQPEFETQAQTEANAAAETKEQTVTTENTNTTAADAGVAATTAIAKAATTAVAPALKFRAAMADLKDAFDTSTVEALGLGTTRIKGEQGSFFSENEDLGATIRFEPVSWNYRWVVGTGEDDKEAKDFFKVSYDNETISGSGEDFHAYLESLKAQGFNKARISQYGDIFGFITWTEKKGEIPAEERQLVILQASPTSVGAFTSFCVSRGLLESKGLAKPLTEIEVRAEKRQKDSNKFTNFSFHAPKA